METAVKNALKRRFAETSEDQIQAIIGKKNRENTHKATKLWMSCFTDFLIEKGYEDADAIPTEDLPQILEQFYSCVSKKPSTDDPQESEDDQEDDNTSKNPYAAIMPPRKKKKNYKNTSMKAIRAALARYYHDKCSVDIISNEHFLRANAVFNGILQLNKESGLGNIVSKSEMSDLDMGILTNYFRNAMAGPPNPKKLQDIVIFYILYYMCRRGRENLRGMTKETFQIKTDPSDGRLYIFQDIDEADKNHTYNDTTKSNDGRIYEDPGTLITNFLKFHVKL